MTPEPDLFDQPIPAQPEILFWPQFWRLFDEHHWRYLKESSRAGALIRYILAEWQGRAFHLIRAQDADNLLKILATKYGQGPWSLQKARMIIRLVFNKAERWKEDGGVGNVDLTRLLLPRRNPGKHSTPIQSPPPIEHVSPWEYRTWIRLAREIGDRKLVAALRIGIWCRLSPIDLVQLDDSEVDETKFEIRVFRRHTRTSKNPAGVLQRIHLTERIWGEIAVCRQFRRPGVTGIIDQTNLRRRMAKIRKLAVARGIHTRFSLRILRRSAAQHLKDVGYDDGVIAEALAHTTTKMVRERYTVGASPNLKKATVEIVEVFDE